ncbi:hypothetical protein [Pelagivirga sediminicola]|uniref:hypothetical protein n=1 Tax=Pelagivirga sediminicola TaxID=2170575 RepID=UPI001A9C9BFF|nr:hypothetical protein [Pelagivirga sediminicola]
MSEPPATGRPVFVARGTYRRRRMVDAAAMLPILGALLFMLPLLWVGAGGGAARTSIVMIYVFAVWTLLVVLSVVITRILGSATDTRREEDEAAEGAPDSAAGSGPDHAG